MSKHTPGPWEIQGGVIASEDGMPVGEIMIYDINGCGVANARLIAAAPDLLEALENLASEYEEAVQLDSGKNSPESVIAARNLIAKARGDQ